MTVSLNLGPSIDGIQAAECHALMLGPDCTEAGRSFLVMKLGDDVSIILPGLDYEAVEYALLLGQTIKAAALNMASSLSMRAQMPDATV